MPDWLQTNNGGKFHVANPAPEEIDVRDIAHALSMLCRYSGHCKNFYSVAEHCCHIYDWLPVEYKLEGLMHDASEAYLVDIPRPIKPYLNNYYDLEKRIMAVIAMKYGFPGLMTERVKEADNRILRDERYQNMMITDVPDEEWGCPLPALDITLKYWSPKRAEKEFLKRFKEIVNV
jgi:hypothetical protein